MVLELVNYCPNIANDELVWIWYKDRWLIKYFEQLLLVRLKCGKPIWIYVDSQTWFRGNYFRTTVSCFFCVTDLLLLTHWGRVTHVCVSKLTSIIPPPNEVGGGVYWIHLVHPSVCPSIQLVTRYLVNLLVRIKEPSSPTGWQQSPLLQAEETKKSRKLDCVATGFIYDDAVNFTVDVRPSVRLSVDDMVSGA